MQPSDGTLQRWVIHAGERLNGVYEAADAAVVEAKVAHFDERGMRMAGTLRWLHVATSETAVYYATHAHRVQEAMNAAEILRPSKAVPFMTIGSPTGVTRTARAPCAMPTLCAN